MTTINIHKQLSGWTTDQAFNLDFGEQFIRAKIGYTYEANEFSYDTIDVYSEAGEVESINLNEQSSIEVVNASNAQGANIIIGQNSAGNDTLIGGAGTNSMWRGEGGNDFIYSGTGETEVFYGTGSGTDIVLGSKDNM